MEYEVVKPADEHGVHWWLVICRDAEIRTDNDVWTVCCATIDESDARKYIARQQEGH